MGSFKLHFFPIQFLTRTDSTPFNFVFESTSLIHRLAFRKRDFLFQTEAAADYPMYRNVCTVPLMNEIERAHRLGTDYIQRT